MMELSDESHTSVSSMSFNCNDGVEADEVFKSGDSSPDVSVSPLRSLTDLR